MASASDFETAKAYLQQKGASGVSLYEHVSELLLRVLDAPGPDALAMFERLSAAVKAANVQPSSAPSAGSVLASVPLNIVNREAAVAWAGAAGKLHRAPEAAEGVDDSSPVQDVADEANYLEWAGVSIGREEAFRAGLALRHLAAATGAAKLRLWGKMLGRDADYYIAEGVLAGGDEEEGRRDSNGVLVEGAGTGANVYTYWAASFPGAEWVKLPNVLPEQVVAARQIRRFLTGNLDAAVGGHPPFPGNEAAFLRAQIARISAGTMLSPSGFLTVPDAEGAPLSYAVNEEEWEAPNLSELGSWVHSVVELNVRGRALPQPPKMNDDGEPIVDESEPAPAEALRAIDGEEGAWSVRGVPTSGRAAESEPSLVVVRSLRWPGAVTVGFGKRFANFYVGYGLKYAPDAYSPPAPGNVSSEYASKEDAPFREGTDVTSDPTPPADAAPPAESEE